MRERENKIMIERNEKIWKKKEEINETRDQNEKKRDQNKKPPAMIGEVWYKSCRASQSKIINMKKREIRDKDKFINQSYQIKIIHPRLINQNFTFLSQ